MTIQECYERLGGNYNDAKSRLMNDRLIDRFICKFPADDSMQLLETAVSAGDIKEAFRGAHTLKGVAANLAFTELQQAASDLTEQLRPQTEGPDEAKLARVREAYQLVIDTLAAYQAEK